MRRKFALLLVPLFALASPALADIAAIHAERLPQETAVLAALDDIRQLEPYVSAWSNDWKFSIPKREVSDRLEKDLGLLATALNSHPDNVELALLTGLSAHYAYNLDVPNSHDKAIAAFETARKLAPSDVRVSWFHANLLCQTLESKPGAEEFLAIESSHPWDQLPVAFWNDYTFCATVTNMPAHVLRAASYLDKLHAPSSDARRFIIEMARKRFDPYDPRKNYDPKDVWYGSSGGADPSFTSTTCGVRLTAHRDWTIKQLALGNGVCVAYFSTGPYKATTRDLHPSVMLLVRQPKPGESLADFVKLLTHGDTTESFTPIRCPSSTCINGKGVQPGMYKADGDGKGRTIAFERDEPDFPGLIFESPAGAPKTSADAEPQFFRPSQTEQRIPGRLYYLVLLDTASSIEDAALKDFDFFLNSLIVE
jgi:hypothetical protein